MRERFIRWLRAGAVLVMVSGGPAAAQQQAQAMVDLNLRAGPAKEYPVVSVLQAGTYVAIQACLADYSWCDVAVPPLRGWVYAGNLLIQQNGSPQAVNMAGAIVGIGVTSFILNSYWRDHYYNRPWYGQANYWNHYPPYQHRPPYYHPPPPPPHYRPPPPHYRPPPPQYRPPASNYRPPPPPAPPHARPPYGGSGGSGYRPPPPPPPPGGGGGGRPPPQAR